MLVLTIFISWGGINTSNNSLKFWDFSSKIPSRKSFINSWGNLYIPTCIIINKKSQILMNMTVKQHPFFLHYLMALIFKDNFFLLLKIISKIYPGFSKTNRILSSITKGKKLSPRSKLIIMLWKFYDYLLFFSCSKWELNPKFVF